MKIQIISYSTIFKINDPHISQTISAFDRPRSFDEFDLNIIDLNSPNLWSFNSEYQKCTEAVYHLKTLKEIMRNSKRGIFIIIMPANIKVSVHYPECYTNQTVVIKDILKQVDQELSTLALSNIKLRYEISTTTINERNFYSDFIFDNVEEETIKWSNGGKSTIVKHNERLYSTTLLIKNTTNDLEILISFIVSRFKKSDVPDWFNSLEYFDDAALKNKRSELLNMYRQIKDIDRQIDKNNRFKSILYSNGDELIDVVKGILVDIFKLQDDHFIDVKKEDFRFKFRDINFIVEIKGINTNVKNSNIAQCKKHVTDFLIAEDTMSPNNVKGLLIINPQRDIDPSKREPIHADQINYAKSEDILIITTLELLKLYQAYTKDKVVSNVCFEVFKNDVGEFKFKE
ncbi:hypothetical protein CVT06_02975 [Campylobacter concisus]|uniref:Restriction endonuclease n=1 Tax=Campylobacter concisus TaxID=199 RepID=A0A7S9NED9_9BACT|nr:hypothetical protein [Campylobacter concisus]QPH84111.1 hypothetical protein CVT06_02975 [Campylobacter concisus]